MKYKEKGNQQDSQNNYASDKAYLSFHNMGLAGIYKKFSSLQKIWAQREFQALLRSTPIIHSAFR